jgi:hypothetical protein
MGEDPGDHGGFGDRGDDPHQPLAPGTGERIDLEDAAEQLRPAESGCAERPAHRLDDRDRRLGRVARLPPPRVPVGSVLLRDIADVKRLKQEDGPNLVTQGSTELVHALLANVGGKKLFADGSAPYSFKLTRSRVSPNGLIVGHYEREGEIRIGDTTLDSPANVRLPAKSA